MPSIEFIQLISDEVIVSLHEEDDSETPRLASEEEMVPFQNQPYFFDVLSTIVPLSLKEQTLMLCSLLTLSGYTIDEIADALDMNPSTYRSRISGMRRKLRDHYGEDRTGL